MQAPAQPARATQRWHWALRWRWWTLAVFVGLGLWLLPGISRVVHDDDVLAFLPPDEPEVVAFEDLARRFGMLEVALVGLRGREGEDLLTARGVSQVRGVAQAVGELPGVRLVLSFPELPDLRVVGDTLNVDPLVPVDLVDAATIRDRVLANSAARGNLISADGRAAVLLVYLVSGPGRASVRDTDLAQIRDAVGLHWPGTAVFGGSPFVQEAAARATRADMTRLSPAVIAVLMLVSAVALRSVLAAAINLLVTGLGVGLIVGAHGILGEPFTIVSGTLPVLLVAMGGAFSVHMISGYQRQVGCSLDRADAALRELAIPVILSALTTAVGFFALVAMPQVPMSRFGVIAGLGVLTLLALALFVTPGLLALVPQGWIRHVRPRPIHWAVRAPLWLLLALALAGVATGLRLQADPDTRHLFDEDSAPGRADRFFEDWFGGSQFVQIGVTADVTDPIVLRAIRDLVDRVRGIDRVADVRSLIEPVEMVTEGFGGQRGIPADGAQGARVVAQLADQPAMAQLLLPDRTGAVIHVKLAPMAAREQDAVLDTIASIVAEAGASGSLRVGDTRDLGVAQLQREDVRRHLSAVIGRAIDPAAFDAAVGEADSDPEEDGIAIEWRQRALGSDELIEPLDAAVIAQVEPRQLMRLSGSALAHYLRVRLPGLVASDPKGIDVLVEQLQLWRTQWREHQRLQRVCATLEIPDSGPVACAGLAPVVAELEAGTWRVPDTATVPTLGQRPWHLALTGQPLIGRAFARSVTDSLGHSTLLSIAGLVVILAATRRLSALIPAFWTLLLTALFAFVLGHPIGVGTSMVACIALGAGVDFAIHLQERVRRGGGQADGASAVRDLGGTILVAGLQLGSAFLVLLASSMPPLRDFGMELAIGLVGAALGSLWWAPYLWPGIRLKRGEVP